MSTASAIIHESTHDGTDNGQGAGCLNKATKPRKTIQFTCEAEFPPALDRATVGDIDPRDNFRDQDVCEWSSERRRLMHELDTLCSKTLDLELRAALQVCSIERLEALVGEIRAAKPDSRLSVVNRLETVAGAMMEAWLKSKDDDNATIDQSLVEEVSLRRTGEWFPAVPKMCWLAPDELTIRRIIPQKLIRTPTTTKADGTDIRNDFWTGIDTFWGDDCSHEAYELVDGREDASNILAEQKTPDELRAYWESIPQHIHKPIRLRNNKLSRIDCFRPRWMPGKKPILKHDEPESLGHFCCNLSVDTYITCIEDGTTTKLPSYELLKTRWAMQAVNYLVGRYDDWELIPRDNWDVDW